MKEFVRTILDYPVKGIEFRDITTLLQNAGHFKKVIDEMTEPWENKKIEAVLSIESRGFIMAGAIAYKLNAAFNINMFVSGDLVDEHGAAAVAH